MTYLRFLLPLALIALCLVLADGQHALDRLAGASPGWLAVTFLLLNLVTILSALRWRLTARGLGLRLEAGAAVREYYVAQFVNQTLPGGVLGDASRVMRNRDGGPVKRSAQAVVLERAAGQAGMAAILALGVAAAFVAPARALPGGMHLPGLVWLPVALLALVPLALIVLARGRMRAGGWPQAVRDGLIRQFPAQAILSLAVAGLTVTAFACAARATGTHLAPAAVALLVPLILTAMLLPASIAGWGWREGAAAAVMPLAGASAAAGLAASLAFGLVMLAASLPGAFFLVRWRGRRAEGPVSVAPRPD